MTFVNELIPESEKEKFTFSVQTAYDGSKPTLWKWTIDREKGVFLVLTKSEGGAYEGTQVTEHYVLNWKGNLIHFAGAPVVSGSIETGQVMSWRVHHLVIPSALIGRQEEVMNLIREALDAMGWLYRRERVAAVNVDFDLCSSR